MGAAVSPIRLIGAVGAESARADADDGVGPAFRWKAGFAGRVVDDMDQPLAGALVVALPAATSARPAAPERGGFGWWPGLRGWLKAEPPPAARDEQEVALAGGLPLMASTRADGRFVLPEVPPGRYLLFAVHAGPPPATSDAMVVDGRSLTVPLRLVITRGAHLL